MPTADATTQDEQVYRASAYSLLAALLRAPPDQALLDHLGQLSPSGDAEPDELYEAMRQVAETASEFSLEQLDDEYHALFIGIGRGEVMPYGSWYLTGYLMEKPLSDLRDDLRLLGFERSPDTHEPEDHISAIFEVFSVMIADGSSLEMQQNFFNKHMDSWLERFFTDLGKAGSAGFYRPVARFGAAFIELEKAYLSMRS
ncbi:MAG TPA: molecular chaperone TorD family protein [Gammaproteobacteria bacterium]|nr:molecular chaperone TorD family protein [Gammaproteobacteria bacterium]